MVRVKPRAQYRKDAQHAYLRLEAEVRKRKALEALIKAHRDAVLEDDWGADERLWTAIGLSKLQPTPA